MVGVWNITVVSNLEDGEEEACSLIYGEEILKSGILLQSKYKVLTEMPKHVGECKGSYDTALNANNYTNLLELNEKNSMHQRTQAPLN